MNTNETTIDIGDIKFYDNYVPNLKAGNYRIEVSQMVDDIDTGDLEYSKSFIVNAPQFALSPTDIHTQYPPDNSTGQFADCLPHIVFNNRIIPWERRLGEEALSDEVRLPWMALLVFTEDELIYEKHKTSMENKDLISGDDAFNKAYKTTVGEFLKPSDDMLKAALTKEDDIANDDTCFYIKMHTDLFTKLLPRLKELAYLTHVRQVNTGDKAILGIKDDGWFSVNITNRFPKSDPMQKGGVRHIVHLVSLENLGKYLTDAPVFTISGKKDGAREYDTIALLSLARWSFRCLPDNKENFKGLMENLITSEHTEGQEYHPENLWLRLPSDRIDPGSEEAGKEVKERLDTGYVPHVYHTRTGEETFAWYRGPFTPFLTKEFLKPEPFASADAAIIYDNQNGVFDLSLAIAWQTGRALALASQTYCLQLLDFRRKSHRITDMLLERLRSDHFDNPQDIADLAKEHLIQDKFIELLKKDLLKTIADKPKGDPGKNTPQTPVEEGNSPQKDLEEFMARDDVNKTMAEISKDDLEPVAAFLAKLKLLYGVSFNNLVPNPKMLPKESIRFFYLDSNWLDALIDGALALGLQSSRDTFHFKMTKGLVSEAMNTELKSLLGRLRGSQTDSGADFKTHMSGMLIRSAIVSGWPGLSVRPRDESGDQLQILRMERLSDSVLLCIFQGVPSKVELSEPQEGFRFGVDEQGAVELRNIAPEYLGEEFGQYQIRDLTGKEDIFMRPKSEGRILNLNPDSPDGLIEKLTVKLNQHLSKKIDLLKPSDFAIQMIRSPERMSFMPLSESLNTSTNERKS